jgi:hypothetical protein
LLIKKQAILMPEILRNLLFRAVSEWHISCENINKFFLRRQVMEKIITQRKAQDDYHAVLVAQGMENAGADVISITNDNHGYIQVYCRHPKSVSAEKIDREISREVESKAEYYLS